MPLLESSFSHQITEIFACSDTGYSDSLLTVTLFANPTLPMSVTVSTYLPTITLCPVTDDDTVSEYLCNAILLPEH